MGIIETVRSWIGDDEEAAFVCLKCGSEYERQFQECTACGNPYVVPTDEE